MKKINISSVDFHHVIFSNFKKINTLYFAVGLHYYMRLLLNLLLEQHYPYSHAQCTLSLCVVGKSPEIMMRAKFSVKSFPRSPSLLTFKTDATSSTMMHHDKNGANFEMMKQKGVSFYTSGLSPMSKLSLFFRSLKTSSIFHTFVFQCAKSLIIPCLKHCYNLIYSKS